MLKKAVLLVLLCLMAPMCAMGQTNPQNPSAAQPTAASATRPATQPAPSSAAQPDPKAKPASPATPPAEAKTPLTSTKIPSGSKLFVAPMGGFENYVVAGIVKKKVPVVIVADRDKADYEIHGSAETEKAGWAKMLILGVQNSNEQASINVTDVKTGNIVFAYSVNKLNSYKGKQSAGEAIGKHLNEAIGKD